MFVLWLSGQHSDSSVSVVSDSHHWLLHSKELDQINVLIKSWAAFSFYHQRYIFYSLHKALFLFKRVFTAAILSYADVTLKYFGITMWQGPDTSDDGKSSVNTVFPLTF